MNMLLPAVASWQLGLYFWIVLTSNFLEHLLLQVIFHHFEDAKSVICNYCNHNVVFLVSGWDFEQFQTACFGSMHFTSKSELLPLYARGRIPTRIQDRFSFERHEWDGASFFASKFCVKSSKISGILLLIWMWTSAPLMLYASSESESTVCGALTPGTVKL